MHKMTVGETVGTLRAVVRATAYERIDDAELERLSALDAESRHNDFIEGLVSEELDALYAMLREERAPVSLRHDISRRYVRMAFPL